MNHQQFKQKKFYKSITLVLFYAWKCFPEQRDFVTDLSPFLVEASCRGKAKEDMKVHTEVKHLPFFLFLPV